MLTLSEVIQEADLKLSASLNGINLDDQKFRSDHTRHRTRITVVRYIGPLLNLK